MILSQLTKVGGFKKKKRCEHHYPYFIRWYDDFSESGKMIERHCYCFKCEKEYILRLNPKSLYMMGRSFGLEKGRETIEDLRRELPNIIKKYNKNIKKKEVKPK